MSSAWDVLCPLSPEVLALLLLLVFIVVAMFATADPVVVVVRTFPVRFMIYN